MVFTKGSYAWKFTRGSEAHTKELNASYTTMGIWSEGFKSMKAIGDCGKIDMLYGQINGADFSFEEA